MSSTDIRNLAARLAQAAADLVSIERAGATTPHWPVAVAAAHRIALQQLRRGLCPGTVQLAAVTAARRAVVSRS